MRKKLGIQFQFDSSEALRYDREVWPVAVMGIEVDKADYWRQFTAPIRIWRHHPNRPWAEDPERQARDAVGHIAGQIGHLLAEGLITHITDNNEFILGIDHVTPELIEKADRYISTFIPTARAELGVGTCWLNGNTGHHGPETVDLFPRSLEVASEDGDSFICWHEYNWPIMLDPTLWTCGKFLHAMPPILEKYPDLRCGITETGVDDGGYNPEHRHWGWRKAFPTYEECLKQFTANGVGLDWYNEKLNSVDWLEFAIIFGCGMLPDWAPFDIANSEVIERVKMFPGVEIPPGNNGNGGNNMVKVYDFNNSPPDGETRDLAWLASVFGPKLKIHPVTEKYQPQQGERIYIVDYLDARVGESSCIINVRDRDGNPVEGETTVFYWPTAEPIEYPEKPWFWTKVGATGDTNQNGDTGPGMGTGAYYDPKTEEGPHRIWVVDLPCEMVSGVGMLAGGEPEPGVEGPHAHVNIGYREILWEGEKPSPEPPSPPPSPGTRVVQVDLRVTGTITL